MPTYKRSTRNRNRTRTRTHNRGGGQTIVERIQKRWFGENEKWQAKLNKLEASLHETRDKMARVARENKNLIDKAAKQAIRTKKQTERDRKNAMYMGMGGVTIGALAGAGGTVLTRGRKGRNNIIIQPQPSSPPSSPPPSHQAAQPPVYDDTALKQRLAELRRRPDTPTQQPISADTSELERQLEEL